MNRFLIVLLFLSTIASRQVHAQTCGITAGITVIISYSQHEGYLKADTSSLQPGWTCYRFQWNVNNYVYTANVDSFANLYYYGHYNVCLKIFATNPGTGDSCVSEYCNLFFSPGDMIAPFMDISESGNTIDFAVSFFNNDVPYNNDTYHFDFGDGNTYSGTGGFGTNTYASPGFYYVTCMIDIAGGQGAAFSETIWQGIWVGGGGSNVEIYPSGSQTVTCDSLFASAPDPGGASGSNSYAYNSSLLSEIPQPAFVGNNVTPIKLRNNPGFDYLYVEKIDASGSNDWMPYMFAVQPCNSIPDTAYGSVFEDLNFNGLHDAGEPGIPGATIRTKIHEHGMGGLLNELEYLVQTDSSGNYKIPVPRDDMEFRIDYVYAWQVLTFPGGNLYIMNYDSTTTTHGPYNFGIANLNTRVCCFTYTDIDGDSTYNSSIDNEFGQVMYQCHENVTGIDYYKAAENDGSGCFYLLPGNYTIKPAFWPIDSADVYPDSIIINSPAGGNFYNNYFGFTSPVSTNFKAIMYHHGDWRPGFNYQVGTRISNSGIQPSQGNVVLNYDTLLVPISHTPPNGILNTSNHTISWLTDSIIPGQQRYYEGKFGIPASVPLGTQLTSFADITPAPGFNDAVTANNSDTINVLVIGSFDPNDKLVHPAGLSPSGMVLHNTRLNYRIRFQNTGTASAIHVFVTDTIDQNMDLSTLQFEGSSHPCDIVIHDRVITWKFLGINLPDSTTNLELSQGYVDFSINPLPGLAEGTTVTNLANIYFDFNTPVATPPIINTYVSTLVGIQELVQQVKLSVYPVPAREQCHVIANNFEPGKALLTITDLTGRVFFEKSYQLKTNEERIVLDIHEYPSGYYFVNLFTQNRNTSAALMKY